MIIETVKKERGVISTFPHYSRGTFGIANGNPASLEEDGRGFFISERSESFNQVMVHEKVTDDDI